MGHFSMEIEHPTGSDLSGNQHSRPRKYSTKRLEGGRKGICLGPSDLIPILYPCRIFLVTVAILTILGRPRNF